MKRITPELLKAANFKPIDRDKLTVKWELRTDWQTVTLWQYTPTNRWTLGGIKNSDDRATVNNTDQLIEIAKAFGADANTYAILAAME